DDVQWADDDTLRLLRYVIRAATDRPIFLYLAIRPDEFAGVSEAVNLVADMERMGVVRRLRLGRLSAPETGQLARQLLGGSLDPPSAQAIHSQSEGVPFIVEELVRTYSDAGLLQQLDGVWRLTRNAARLVPSAVRTLVQRRSARLPAETRAVLSDAAVVGRSFSLRDLQEVRGRIGTEGSNGAELGDLLAPAVDAGLILQHPPGVAADYTFTHEQVRDFSAAELTQSRRRQLHRALVDLMLEAGDPPPSALPLVAHHALAAGDSDRAGRLCMEAARAALRSNAPEEALRLVEQALPVISTPEERLELLKARDDAYAALRRSADRLEGLAELAALAEASRDPDLELEVQLRRTAALRLARDTDAAAELARRITARAAANGNRQVELRAHLELGQALTGTSLGESYGASAGGTELGGAEDAFRRAVTLAEELGDERNLAAALRELGTIFLARARLWFGEQRESGRGLEFGQRAAAGEPAEAVLAGTEIGPLLAETRQVFERALEIFERLGDRTGVMSTVIAMAYVNYAPVIALTSSARHLEEIRRVISRLSTMVTESERSQLELQMLYGVHVFARAKVVPDLMVSRGEEAHRMARINGDSLVEFLAAGGVALAHAEMGDIERATSWLERASSAAAAVPTRARARQLETWRGMVRAAAGDGAGMRRHLELAVQMAGDDGRPAARCEVMARLSVEAARLGADTGDAELLELAERTAQEVKRLYPLLPGRAPWVAQADAALAQVTLARGDSAAAATAGGEALEFMQTSNHDDVSLEILLPASEAVLAGGPPQSQAMVRTWLQIQVARIARGTADEEIRVRWLRGPWGRRLVALAGTPDEASAGAEPDAGDAAWGDLDDDERTLLRLLTRGSTNREMADQLGIDTEAVAQRLARLHARIGAG
ncbi:MAG TPA: hypothetical protein VHK63_00135, partial [Candidatus Limnocylindria bacterium]|nr:hypothetical protein [Candidatus Limnocylindria bacterium]